MPRIQTLICSGICFLVCSLTTAQSLPKNPTPQQVATYQVYQQKKWNFDQLHKKSIQYGSDRKHFPVSNISISSARFNLIQLKMPEVKKNFGEPSELLHNNSKPYLQQYSRFLKYMWPNQAKEQSFISHSL